MVDNGTIITEDTKRGLEKLESFIDTNNLRHCGILSKNLHDELGDRSDNLRVVVEKVDPIHMNIVINKHDIVAIARNKGGEGPQTLQ